MYEAVITGLGPVAPNGIGIDMFWEAIASGKSGIRRISKFEAFGYSCQAVGEIPPAWIDGSLKKMPNWLPDAMSCKLSVLAMNLALEDAGLAPKEVENRSSAVYVGVSTTDMEVVQREFTTQLGKGAPREDFLVSAFPHTPATIIAHFLKSTDNVTTVSTACTSGLNSIHYAAECINRGEADIVIAGGVDTPLSPLVLAGFCSAGMVPTEYNDTPEKASRPFDQKRKGGILSEGAAVVILEEKEKALRRGAKIYALYGGGGMSTDIAPSRMKKCMYTAMSKALREACLKPNEIDYICACAPGDLQIDQAETEAIKELFGAYAYNIPISSIKSMIGNPGSAAGPLQVIAASLSINKRFIFPTVNLEQTDASCDLDCVPGKGRIARVKNVMINLRGFGGGISSMVITQAV